MVDAWLIANSGVARFNDAARSNGIIVAQQHNAYDPYPEGKTSYNVLGEIPGSDKADEVVMLGGHLDSWHAATGATDNGIGSSIMIEAIRVLQTLKLKPRRTVRVAFGPAKKRACSDLLHT